MGPLPSLHPCWWEATLILLIAQPRAMGERAWGHVTCQGKGHVSHSKHPHPTSWTGPPIPQRRCVCACAPTLVCIRDFASVEFRKVESCVSGGCVCPRQPECLCVSRKCDVRVGVSASEGQYVDVNLCVCVCVRAHVCVGLGRLYLFISVCRCVYT